MRRVRDNFSVFDMTIPLCDCTRIGLYVSVRVLERER